MAIDRIVLIGAGGHARVVLDALLADGISPAAITVRDAHADRALLMLASVAPEIDATLHGCCVHVAIGNVEVRARLSAAARATGAGLVSVTHPRAVVSCNAKVGKGVFIAAGAVVGPGAAIGDGVIVNHGAVVDHDCVVGEFAHIAPNATLGGAAQVGARTVIGAGAVVLPGVHIGEDTIVGAGTIVSRAIGGGIWIGAPARRTKDNENNGAD